MRSPRRKAPSVPASLQRSASASNRRFSLPENWRRLAIATTSGSRRAAASEAVSPVALRAPSATASEEEEPNDPFIEDFSNEVMCMSYLYSKLPETGVSPHIGTGGAALSGLRTALVCWAENGRPPWLFVVDLAHGKLTLASFGPEDIQAPLGIPAGFWRAHRKPRAYLVDRI